MTEEQDESAIVWPDREVTLSNGSNVEVYQLRAAHEDRLHDDLVPIRQRVLEMVGHSDDPALISDSFWSIIDEHGPALSRLVRASTDLSEGDWNQLTSDDASDLKITWLAIHLRPFARLRLSVKAVSQALARGTSAGSNSPAPSSEPDTPEPPEV